MSWVFVALLTAVNIFVFLKLKKASEQMMKMAFPNAKNMNDALGQMQNMMGSLGGRGGMPGMGAPGKMNPQDMQAQMKMAMDMLAQIQNKGGKAGRR